MKETHIPIGEAQFSKLSLVDTGRVFRWRGALYRAVSPEASDSMRQLFSSGLVDKLVSDGLLVASRISNARLDGYGLVIEHHRVEVVSYPREWTFTMLKNAALLVLRINEVAAGFGFQTKDCHGYNVLFEGDAPIFIDLGSFTPAGSDTNTLLSYDEFLRSYYYPLRVWSQLGPFWGAKVALRPTALLSTEDYLRLRLGPLRRGANTVASLVSRLRRLQSLDEEELNSLRQRQATWKAAIARALRSLGRSRASFGRLRRRVAGLEPPPIKTLWSDYHDKLPKEVESPLSDRFRYVADSLLNLPVRSVLEVAGNQGLLSRELKRRRPQLLVTCTDADEPAVDKGYRASCADSLGVSWAVLNPFFAEEHSAEDPPASRFRADAVVALALTHHLIISMGLPPGWILDVLARYARRFLLVEFMPLGLYDGTRAQPLPAGYTEDRFRRAFEERCKVLDRRQLEHRVLYIGELRHAS